MATPSHLMLLNELVVDTYLECRTQERSDELSLFIKLRLVGSEDIWHALRFAEFTSILVL